MLQANLRDSVLPVVVRHREFRVENCWADYFIEQTVEVSTVIPRLTKTIRFGITFVSRNVISRRFL